MEHFAPRARFHALVVEDGGSWVAALPLVGRRVAGQLLGRRNRGQSLVVARRSALGRRPNRRRLPSATPWSRPLARLPWQLLWLEGADIERAAMAGIAEKHSAARARRPSAASDWLTGRLPIDHDWPACQQRWSKRHRRNMARCSKRLAAHGKVTLEFCDRLACGRSRAAACGGRWKSRTPAGKVRRALRSCAARACSTSSCARPSNWPAWDQLALAMLYCGGRPVAFAYGLAAKEVFHSWKVGYDRRFGRLQSRSIAALLSLIERFHADAGYRGHGFHRAAQRRAEPLAAGTVSGRAADGGAAA